MGGKRVKDMRLCLIYKSIDGVFFLKKRKNFLSLDSEYNMDDDDDNHDDEKIIFHHHREDQLSTGIKTVVRLSFSKWLALNIVLNQFNSILFAKWMGYKKIVLIMAQPKRCSLSNRAKKFGPFLAATFVHWKKESFFTPNKKKR